MPEIQGKIRALHRESKIYHQSHEVHVEELRNLNQEHYELSACVGGEVASVRTGLCSMRNGWNCLMQQKSLSSNASEQGEDVQHLASEVLVQRQAILDFGEQVARHDGFVHVDEV